MKTRRTFLSCLSLATAAAVVLPLSAVPALAADGSLLSESEITQAMLDQGYAKVLRMEMEDGLYEVKVKTKDGKRMSLNVDPKTGKVLGTHKDGWFDD